jgi:hypothetical protein
MPSPKPASISRAMVALQDAVRRAIATRGGYCSWDVDHAGWVVTLSSPGEHTFYERTLEKALA